MGLPVRQRRVLDVIESGLRRSDPRLAVMFAIFGRLTRDEEMPRFEELRDRAASLRARAVAVGRRIGRTGTRYRVAVFFPAALMLMTLAIVLVARFGSPRGCAPVASVATAKPHPKGKQLIARATSVCRPGLIPVSVGR
jgi:hypothetical protein